MTQFVLIFQVFGIFSIILLYLDKKNIRIDHA